MAYNILDFWLLVLCSYEDAGARATNYLDKKISNLEAQNKASGSNKNYEDISAKESEPW